MSSPERTEPPQPRTPIERLLVLAVIYGTAFVIAIVLLILWAAMVLKGEGSSFPSDLRLILQGDMLFLFGGALAVKIVP